MSASRSNSFLLNHLSKCRCCFKRFGRRDKQIKITTTIEKQFFDLTNLELKVSTMYSRYFCEECSTKLDEITEFREASKLKQNNLYEFIDDYTNGLNSSGCRVKEEYIEVKESSFLDEFEHNEYNQFEPEVKIEKDDEQIFLGESFWTQRDGSTDLNDLENTENMLCDDDSLSYEAINTTNASSTSMDNSTKPIRARPVCSLCFVSFNSKTALNFHVKRVHLKVKNCFCDCCGYSCLGKETMRHHMITHVELENRIKYPCHLCSVICISLNGYHTHVKNVHGERKIHNCPECDKKFTTSQGMKEHIKSFHRHEKYECPICNKFFSKHSIGRHNRRFHGIFLRNTRLTLKPKSEGSTIKKQPAICPECGVSYNSQPALTYHLKRVHLKVKDSFCDVCGYACLGRDSIRTHMITHINLEDRKKTFCTICKGVFISAVGLQTHMKSIHGEKKVYECRDCGKSLKSLHGFRNHVKNTHQRVEHFDCTICNKSYGTARILKGHITTAHGEKTIACEICGKMYPTINRLKNHLIYHDEPKYICDVEGCSKKFFVQELLISHKKTHIGQRDFACHLCDKKYFLSSHLTRHILHFHKQLKVACELPGCTSKFARKETYRNHVLSHHKDLSQAAVEALLKKIRELVQA